MVYLFEFKVVVLTSLFSVQIHFRFDNYDFIVFNTINKEVI